MSESSSSKPEKLTTLYRSRPAPADFSSYTSFTRGKKKKKEGHFKQYYFTRDTVRQAPNDLVVSARFRVKIIRNDTFHLKLQ